MASKPKTKKVKLSEGLQIELMELQRLRDEHVRIANLLNQNYFALLSQEMVNGGYDGAQMVSNGMLPDGTVEIVPQGKVEEVKDEPEEATEEKK